MVVEIRSLDERAKLPMHGSEKAAGYDLWSFFEDGESVEIKPGETKAIGTGVAMAIPDGYFGGIFARSSTAIRGGLRPANCVGVIDSDYRGEIAVALHNDSDQIRTIRNHERIAQIVFLPCLPVEFKQVDFLDNTGRGKGGFGSTGKFEKEHEAGSPMSVFDYIKMSDATDAYRR